MMYEFIAPYFQDNIFRSFTIKQNVVTRGDGDDSSAFYKIVTATPGIAYFDNGWVYFRLYAVDLS